MKFRLLSDLHIDSSPFDLNGEECDYIIIAGDVTDKFEMFNEFLSYVQYHKIIFVPGNHDFTGNTYDGRMEQFKNLMIKYPNFTILNNQSVVLDNGRIELFGTTLWSNLEAYGNDVYLPFLKSWATFDCGWIHDWSVNKMIEQNCIAMKSLHEFASVPKDVKKRIVISHFAPSLMSVAQEHVGKVPFNSYWCNSLEDDMMGLDIDVWCHGHTHTNFDYMIGDCRVICNPRGYSDHGIENPSFEPNFIFEI